MEREVKGAVRTQSGCPAPPTPWATPGLLSRPSHPESDVFSAGEKLRSTGFPGAHFRNEKTESGEENGFDSHALAC